MTNQLQQVIERLNNLLICMEEENAKRVYIVVIKEIIQDLQSTLPAEEEKECKLCGGKLKDGKCNYLLCGKYESAQLPSEPVTDVVEKIMEELKGDLVNADLEIVMNVIQKHLPAKSEKECKHTALNLYLSKDTYEIRCKCGCLIEPLTKEIDKLREQTIDIFLPSKSEKVVEISRLGVSYPCKCANEMSRSWCYCPYCGALIKRID